MFLRARVWESQQPHSKKLAAIFATYGKLGRNSTMLVLKVCFGAPVAVETLPLHTNRSNRAPGLHNVKSAALD